jgi:hypothetical protein
LPNQTGADGTGGDVGHLAIAGSGTAVLAADNMTHVQSGHTIDGFFARIEMTSGTLDLAASGADSRRRAFSREVDPENGIRGLVGS